MSYVEKIIDSDEKILTITSLHWIYVVQGALWLLFFLVLGFIADHYLLLYSGSNKIGPNAIKLWSFNSSELKIPVIWFFAGIGISGFLFMYLTYISVEVGLTNKRILYKNGLIHIQIQEVDLIDMRSERVDHGWLGWLLGYGRLYLDCRFMEDVRLPALVKPYDLVKAIHVARAHHPDIDYGEKEMELTINDLKNRPGNRKLL